jgi:uncharacterized protein YuzE
MEEGMRKILSFSVTYDEDADVLYITKCHDAAARGVEDENGIVWRYDRAGEVLSATIMDFRELWRARYEELAEELSRGLHIPTPQARTVLSHVKEGRGHIRQ